MNLGDDLDGRKTALAVAEVARVLSVSQRQIYKLVSEQKIPCFYIGRSIRFDTSTIAEWLRQTMALPQKSSPKQMTPHRDSTRKRA